jgi:hypothetical protein
MQTMPTVPTVTGDSTRSITLASVGYVVFKVLPAGCQPLGAWSLVSAANPGAPRHGALVVRGDRFSPWSKPVFGLIREELADGFAQDARG